MATNAHDAHDVNVSVTPLELSRTPTFTNNSPSEKTVEKDLEADGSPDSPQLSPFRKSLILTVLSGALFFDVFNACAVITALPTVSHLLHFLAP